MHKTLNFIFDRLTLSGNSISFYTYIIRQVEIEHSVYGLLIAHPANQDGVHPPLPIYILNEEIFLPRPCEEDRKNDGAD